MANINAQQLETARRKQAQRIKTNTKRGLGDWEKERDVDVRGTDTSSTTRSDETLDGEARA